MQPQVYSLFVDRIENQFVYMLDVVATSYRADLAHQQAHQHLRRKLTKKSTKISKITSETVLLAENKSSISDFE